MRPLKLCMSAFGPYKDVVEVDFDKLPQSGLYLITGDTGAGKTTIFDGISYALYGEASGEGRAPGMLRCKYSDSDVPTYVELSFEYRGSRYVVRRNPEYMRTAKRGDKQTKQSAEATLILPDGRIVSKPTEVKKYIETIIGVDKSQFSQIAMIAQGDFKKLLLDKTGDRQETFREIFKTSLYLKLQQRLGEEYKNAEEAYKNLQDEIKILVSNVSISEDCPYADIVKGIIGGNLLYKEIRPVIAKLIELDEKEADDTDSKIDALNRKLENQKLRIGEGLSFEEKKNALSELNKRLFETQLEKENIEEQIKTIESKIPENESRKEQAIFIKNELQRYEELDDKNAEIVSLSDNLAILSESLESIFAEREKALNKAVKQKSELDELSKDIYDGGSCEVSLERAKERMSKLEALKKAKGEYEINAEQYDNATIKVREFNEKYLTENEKCTKLNSLFMLEQAGILAKGLKDNEPCPVCGAVIHPKLASISKEAPTEEDIKQAKLQAERAGNLFEEASRQAALLSGKNETLRKNLEQMASAVGYTENNGDISSYIETTEDALTDELDKLSKELENLKRNIARKEALEKTIPECERAIEDYNDKMICGNEKKAGMEASLYEKVAYRDKLSESLRYKSKEEANTAYEALRDAIEEFDKTQRLASENLRAKEETVFKISGQINEVKSFLENKEYYDVNALKTEYDEMSAQRNELTAKSRIFHSRLDNNKAIGAKIEAIFNNLDETLQRYQAIGSMYKTAAGMVSGKGKISLETYVQTSFFDKILKRSAVKLMEMTGGQYELVRRRDYSNKQSQTGLDIDIWDHYAGRDVYRDAASLSGGELFMAALSLSLGFSEEIQESAGGIRLDTMFVDEGFGSLSENALDEAWRMLTKLSKDGNRLIGIISHVSELKSKPVNKLIVSKDSLSGSSIRLDLE